MTLKHLTLLLFAPLLLSSINITDTETINKPASEATGAICINATEARLADLINEYRNSKGLKEIPVSTSLTKVARLHAEDLSENYRAGERCNLHSWSKDPRWSSCCYTPDHKKASCMWDKPRELTSYKGDGYEIAYFSNFDYSSDEAFIKDALKGWKSSRGHNDIMINNGRWKGVEWKAMGIGVYGDYAVVWFGEITDPEGKPQICVY